MEFEEPEAPSQPQRPAEESQTRGKLTADSLSQLGNANKNKKPSTKGSKKR